MRSLLVWTAFLSAGAQAQETTGAEQPAEPAKSGITAQNTSEEGVCSNWSAMPIGPVGFGYADADLAVGRRACPRTEAGIGVRGLATIDIPNFYGNVAGQALLFGSWAFQRQTELFATLEATTFGFTQNATLTKLDYTLGHLTVGVTQLGYENDQLAGSFTGRVLFPSSFEIQGMRLMGFEVGHTVSFQPRRWVELHGSASINLTAGIGPARADPRVGGFAVAGALWRPLKWVGLVLDVSAHVGRISALAPMAALRFQVGSFGIELGASVPVLGNDRRDVVGGLRINFVPSNVTSCRIRSASQEGRSPQRMETMPVRD